MEKQERKEEKYMAQSEFIEANKEIARKVTGTFEKIEDAVTGGYSKVEDTVVSGYTRVEDAFVSRFLTHDGETVEEAKARLKKDQEEQNRCGTPQRYFFQSQEGKPTHRAAA